VNFGNSISRKSIKLYSFSTWEEEDDRDNHPANARRVRLIPSGRIIRMGRRYHRNIRIGRATAILPSFTRSRRDTFVQIDVFAARAAESRKRALPLRVTFASCIMKAKWSFIEKQWKERNLEDDTRGSSEPSIAIRFVEIALMIDKSAHSKVRYSRENGIIAYIISLPTLIVYSFFFMMPIKRRIRESRVE